MKQLLSLLVMFTIILSSTLSLAFEAGDKCTLKKGAVIGIWLLGGKLSPAQMVKDTPITISKITRDFADPKDPNTKEDIGEFLLSYDKPDFYCRIHGRDTYETYNHNLATDIAIFMLNDCK